VPPQRGQGGGSGASGTASISTNSRESRSDTSLRSTPPRLSGFTLLAARARSWRLLLFAQSRSAAFTPGQGRFGEALDRAGLRLVRFHDLRHTFGTHCAGAGTSLRTLQEWMGHRDAKTTEAYADYVPSDHEGALIERAFPPRYSQERPATAGVFAFSSWLRDRSEAPSIG
jgi:hypothetical protein